MQGTEFLPYGILSLTVTRIVAAATLALTMENALWGIATRNTFASVKRNLQGKTAEKVN